MSNPLPVPFSCCQLGTDIPWFYLGKDSHFRDHPAKEVWGYMYQIARPFWYNGWFDEYAEFHSEGWWDHNRQTQTYHYEEHRSGHLGTATIANKDYTGFFYEFDPRPIEVRPTWAYDWRCIVDGAVCLEWPQRVGLFEAWEVGIFCVGVQYLLIPYSGIIPVIIPFIPGIIMGGGIALGGGGGNIASDGAASAMMVNVLTWIADKKRRKKR